MPLEPRLHYLVALANRMPAGPEDQPIAVQRARSSRLLALMGRLLMVPGPKVDISHHLLPVRGGSIVVRIYRAGGGRLPLHVFIHGGGWVGGTLDERDSRCRALAAEAGCVVASVDYRLAPENQYPTAPEDCYAALSWLVQQAELLDIDPAIVSVGGESAGGNLAAALCLMARDRGGPGLIFQLLDIPATDLTMSQPSVTSLGEGYLLTKAAMQSYVSAYVADPALLVEPYVSPLLAGDLSGLPPAMVTTAEYDPLRDDGREYATRLEQAGVPTTYRQLPGHVHASFAFTRLLPSARAYHQDCVTALRRAHRAAAVASGSGA